MKPNAGIDQTSLYESVDEAEFRTWFAGLAAQYPGHPLLAEIETLMQRHIHLQKFADKLSKWSDRQNRKVIEANQKLAEKAITDPLTGLLNRRGMYRRLEAASRQLMVEGKPFGLLLVDLDHFKRINDHFGHQAGDDTLVAVAAAMAGALPTDQDLVSRWGGEEFLALVQVADAGALAVAADALLQAIRAAAIGTAQGTVNPTGSIGAYFCDQPESIDESVDKADFAMYHAKNGGRNRVVSFDEVPPEAGGGEAAGP